MKHGHGLHHLSKRKRGELITPRDQTKKNWVKLLDRFLIIVAFVSPLTTLPQILNIYVAKQASGVSPITWFSYCAFGLPWLTYALVHKDKPLIISSLMWLLVNMIVAIGAVIY